MNQLSSLLNDTWNYFASNLWPLCAIILPFVIPLEIMYAALEFYEREDDLIFWITFAAAMLLYPVYQGALILYMASTMVGEPFPRSQYYKKALEYWVPLMLLYIATTMTITAGFLLLIIPGLIFMARLAFSEFYCILHDEKSMQAYTSSWEQTKEHQWLLLFGILSIFLIAMLPIWFVNLLAESVEMDGVVLTFITDVFYSVLVIPVTIFGFRVYTMRQEMD